jgi:hypothetical protein
MKIKLLVYYIQFMHGYKNERKMYSIISFREMEIIKKADAQPYVMCTTVAKQLSVTVLALNLMENKKNMIQQCVATQPGRKKSGLCI